MTDEEFVRSVYPNIRFDEDTMVTSSSGNTPQLRTVTVLRVYVSPMNCLGVFSANDPDIWTEIRSRLQRRMWEAFQA